MIPREILKEISPIGIHTDRTIGSSSSFFQLFRVTAGMENRQNHDAIRLNQEMNHEMKALKNNGATHPASDYWKALRISRNDLEVLLNNPAKLPAQPFPLAIIPRNRIIKLLLRDAAKDKTPLPFHLPYFVSSLDFTFSNGTTSSGFSRWSRRRLSIRAASPVNKPPPAHPNSTSIASTSSRLSASVSSRIFSRISVALMQTYTTPSCPCGQAHLNPL